MTNVSNSLKVLSRIWGNREGYVFLPWIDGDATEETRKSKYHEGRAFEWPKEETAVKEHLEKHVDDDVYFCPNLFLMKRRVSNVAAEEKALWADLDEVNPESLENDLRPTIAWESSPGRYQAIWLLTEEALLASEAGGLGQRLTYHIGADLGGWDSTQLLRPPGWRNHKPKYREQYGKAPQGNLLWGVGPRYTPAELDEALPELEVVTPGSLGDILDREIEEINRPRVLTRVRSKLPRKAKKLLDARDTGDNDRSNILFFLERSLAEVGCTLAEIVAIVRPTVWNKFAGRNDELKRLQIEASKAIEETRRKKDNKEEEGGGDFEVAEGFKDPENLWDLGRDIPKPKWLIQDIWTQGACGIIAGGPKSEKSFFAAAMAFAIATGEPCFGHFRVNDPGPVLFVQEEDPLSEVMRRMGLIAEGLGPEYHPKGFMKKDKTTGELVWHPGKKPDIDALVREGLILSDFEVMEWLDEKLSQKEYKALFLDPMSMFMGDIDEKAFAEMNHRLLRPIKELAGKYGVAVIIVHHTNKGDTTGKRMGSTILGTQALHAWTEELMVLKKQDGKNEITMALESKVSMGQIHKWRSVFTPLRRSQRWEPQLLTETYSIGNTSEDDLAISSNGSSGKVDEKPRAFGALEELGAGPHTTGKVAEHLGISANGAYKQLKRLVEKGHIDKVQNGWDLKR